MGCKQLHANFYNFLSIVHRKNGQVQKKNALDCYPGGMQMPNRNVTGDYRYNYQGQELDPETGKVAFQLRLYDPRINRWLTTDPKGQYHSPYLAMGNNPVSRIDPDGGTDGPGDGAIVYNQDVPGLDPITFRDVNGFSNFLDEITINSTTPISNTFLNKNLFKRNESMIARQFIGDTRKYSLSDKCGTVDCSRFTREVAEKSGYKIPRVAYDQENWYKENGESSNKLSDAQAGDHIFWKRGFEKRHTGVVLDVTISAEGVKKITVIQSQVNRHRPGSIKVQTLMKNGEMRGFNQPFVSLGRK